MSSFIPSAEHFMGSFQLDSHALQSHILFFII